MRAPTSRGSSSRNVGPFLTRCCVGRLTHYPFLGCSEPGHPRHPMLWRFPLAFGSSRRVRAGLTPLWGISTSFGVCNRPGAPFTTGPTYSHQVVLTCGVTCHSTMEYCFPPSREVFRSSCGPSWSHDLPLCRKILVEMA